MEHGGHCSLVRTPACIIIRGLARGGKQHQPGSRQPVALKLHQGQHLGCLAGHCCGVLGVPLNPLVVTPVGYRQYIQMQPFMLSNTQGFLSDT
jgi:hypothetical protein